MTVTDPIADMFTRIRNASYESHDEVMIPFSKMKASIAKVLQDEGFIKGFALINKDLIKRFVKIELKYTDEGRPVISHIQRVSKSGCRIYLKKRQVPKVLNGFGISLISTPKGVMSGKDARINNVGGEILGEVY